jgi:hypothetical protein
LKGREIAREAGVAQILTVVALGLRIWKQWGDVLMVLETQDAQSLLNVSHVRVNVKVINPVQFNRNGIHIKMKWNHIKNSKKKPGVVAHICNPSNQRLRLEDQEYEARLGYIVRSCLKKPNPNQKKKKETGGINFNNIFSLAKYCHFNM